MRRAVALASLAALGPCAPASPTGPAHALSPPSSSPTMPASVAACTARDGAWRCSSPRPRALALGPEVIPKSWTVPAWVVDGANVSGTAADTNDCTTAATACLTYQEIACHRWQTYSPRLGQATSITWISSTPAGTDPVYFDPYVEAPVTLLGATTQVASGTLSSLIAKNRGAGQLLTATLASGLAVPTLVKNATRSSSAWIYKNTSGATWSLSQPLPTPTSGANVTPNEDDTWSSGDAYAAVTVPAINLRELVNLQTVFTGGTIFVRDLAFGPSASSFDPAVVRGPVNIAECAIETLLRDEGQVTSGPESGLVNDDFVAPFTLVQGTPSGTPGVTYLVGGVLRASGPMFFNGAVEPTADAILGSTSVVWGSADGGCCQGSAYVESGTVVKVAGSMLSVANANYGAVLWGSGTVNLQGTGRFTYPSGAGQAAATFSGVTLQENGQGKSCAMAPSAGTSGCNTTLSPTALDSAAGTSPGCLGVPGGASFCNFGP